MGEKDKDMVSVVDVFLGDHGVAKLATLDLKPSEFNGFSFIKQSITAEHASFLWGVQNDMYEEVSFSSIERPLSPEEVNYCLAYGKYTHHKHISEIPQSGELLGDDGEKLEQYKTEWKDLAEQFEDRTLIVLLTGYIEKGLETGFSKRLARIALI